MKVKPSSINEGEAGEFDEEFLFSHAGGVKLYSDFFALHGVFHRDDGAVAETFVMNATSGRDAACGGGGSGGSGGGSETTHTT